MPTNGDNLLKTQNQPWTHIKPRTDHVLLIGGNDVKMQFRACTPLEVHIGSPRLDGTKSHLRPRYGCSLSNQCVLGWKFHTFSPRLAAITGGCVGVCVCVFFFI